MNNNTSTQPTTGAPIVKRGPGRPRKNPTMAAPDTKPNVSDADLDLLLDELPQINLSRLALKKELALVSKNTSIRLSLNDPVELKLALLLVCMSVDSGQKKASILKECIKRSLPVYFNEQSGKMKKYAAFAATITV